MEAEAVAASAGTAVAAVAHLPHARYSTRPV
jgi:hypothetical protein